MKMPDVPHRVVDPKRKIAITVWAYRELTDAETALYARQFARMHKLKRNSKYDVYTSVQ